MFMSWFTEIVPSLRNSNHLLLLDSPSNKAPFSNSLQLSELKTPLKGKDWREREKRLGGSDWEEEEALHDNGHLLKFPMHRLKILVD